MLGDVKETGLEVEVEEQDWHGWCGELEEREEVGEEGDLVVLGCEDEDEDGEKQE